MTTQATTMFPAAAGMARLRVPAGAACPASRWHRIAAAAMSAVTTFTNTSTIRRSRSLPT
jgi:hypothetical protein